MASKITIEILVEGRNGELVFKPLTGTKEEILEMTRKEKNEIVRHSMEKALEAKKVKA